MTLKSIADRWLIPDWKHAWKMLSLWFTAAAGMALEIPDALREGWISLPDSLKQYFTTAEGHHIAKFILIGSMAARLIQQTKPKSLDGDKTP